MKRFLLITGVLLAWTGYVGAANVTLTADEYKSLMRRMDDLQQTVDSMQGGPDTLHRINSLL